MNLTSSQWALVAPVIAPELKPRGRGRPSQDARAVLDGVLWVLRTGAQWADLPRRFPPYQTCHRHYLRWLKSGVLVECLRRLAVDLEKRQQQDASAIGETTIAASLATSARSWRRTTALLLESRLGQAVLSESAGRALVSSSMKPSKSWRRGESW